MSDVFAEATPYTALAETLAGRIEALIPTHPEILTIESAFDLFKIEGFDCKDLEPSLAQAGWALREARKRYKEKPKVAPSSTPPGRDLILE